MEAVQNKFSKIALDKSIQETFLAAAKKGSLAVCKTIVKAFKNICNSADEEKTTALHYAAENGHLEICCLIIRHIKHKNPGNALGFTPLHLAAQNGHMKVVQLILMNVEDKNPKAKELLDWTPLHLAAQHGHYNICKLLMGSITNKNPINKCGQTPKSLATEKSHQGIALLINEMCKN